MVMASAFTTEQKPEVIDTFSYTLVKIPDDATLEIFRARDEFGEDHYGKAVMARAPQWKDKTGAILITNAGMYLPNGDLLGYCLSEGVYLSRRYVGKFKHAIVQDSRKGKIYMAEVPNYDAICNYNYTVLQLPAIMWNGKYVWKWTKKKTAFVCIIETMAGNMYFVYSSRPRDVGLALGMFQDKFNMKIKNALYLEGGPETTLLTDDVYKYGCYEEDFYPYTVCGDFLPLPNVLAIRQVQPID